MNSIAGSQARVFWELHAELSPHFRSDRNLAARIQKRLSSERRFGSRDRRVYRELLYTCVRFLPWIEMLRARSDDTAFQALVWLAAPIPALARLKSALPAPLAEAKGGTVAEKASALEVDGPLLPDWCRDECPAALGTPNLDVLHSRAPLWLRLQTEQPDSVLSEFRELGWSWRASPAAPDALEVLGDVDVTRTRAFAAGQIEVQDLGSQLLLQVASPPPGGRWLDACAGAGGKTLQLSRLLGPTGGIDAHDIRRAALEELDQRARRAGVRNVHVVNEPNGAYDGVLVDAPCTGSGTWRRAPHLKWCTSAADIAAAASLQQTLLDRFAAHVRPGGMLVYATCSLCRSEDAAVIEAFLASHPAFAPDAAVHRRAAEAWGFEAVETGATLWPAVHDTDGFFVSVLRRHS